MRHIPQIKNPKQKILKKINSNTSNKALYNQTNKELFYYPIDEETYNDALKILENLDTIYFDLDKEEKKQYNQLEKIILQYNIQK